MNLQHQPLMKVGITFLAFTLAGISAFSQSKREAVDSTLIKTPEIAICHTSPAPRISVDTATATKKPVVCYKPKQTNNKKAKPKAVSCNFTPNQKITTRPKPVVCYQEEATIELADKPAVVLCNGNSEPLVERMDVKTAN